MPPSSSSLAAGRTVYQPARVGRAEINLYVCPYAVFDFLEQLPFNSVAMLESFAGGVR